MNQLKRIAGLLWIALGPIAMYFLVKTAFEEIAKKPVLDIKIQWSVFILVFLPITIGIIVFGFYALKGEYDQLPDSSNDLK